MSQADLLSIVVPTRERPDTLKHCLRTILMQDDNRFEVIVSDNYSGPETRAVVESFQDSRIRYVRTDGRLGMSENFEFALSHVKGNWVTIVGDDDGLVPNAVSRFFSMVEGTNIRVVSSLACGFEWPGVADDEESRLICLHHEGDTKKEMRPARRYLEKVLKNGDSYKDLPCLYTGGFMRMDLINEVSQKSAGNIYLSKIPDVYSGVVACCIEEQFLYVWEPLAIGGASRHSNGVQWMKKGIEEAKKSAFVQESTKPFYASLGSGVTQSLSLLVYESYLQSAHLRTFNVNTSLAEQLALSVITVTGSKKPGAVAYAQEVCAINDLPYEDVTSAMKRLKIKRKLMKLKKKIGKILPSSKSIKKQVVTGDPELQTIYDASIRLGKMLGL